MPTKKKLIIVNHFPHYIQDDCWNIVKEYAGITNWTTRWNKLDGIGVASLHNVMRKNLKIRITNVLKDAKTSKKMILKLLFSRKTYPILQELNALLEPKKNPRKINPLLEKVKVGDEVLYKYWLGVVTKVNKTSIIWRRYYHGNEVSLNPGACHQQTFETRRFYYDKCYRDKAQCITQFQYPLMDYETEYNERTIDWGR
jgi:hypothetical protein